jgi:phosphoglycerate dehydrogenase-like enzyme
MKPLSECHILVTPRSFGHYDPRLCSKLRSVAGRLTFNFSDKPLSSQELRALLPGVDGYIAGLDRIDAQALTAANQLQVVSRYGAGVDNVDLEAAKAMGIVVTNTPSANAGAVAELTIALLLLLARPVLAAAEEMRRGGWPRTTGLSLEGKIVGLIGVGRIGKEVARRLTAFDCRILGHDIVVDQSLATAYNVEVVAPEQLLQESDFVSLHVPLLKETRHMVDDKFLRTMKAGAFLVNTARGGLVDEDALYRALDSGRLRGAALDVFDLEPPEADNRLLRLPQLIPTPHMGSHTDGATNNMGWMALENCLAVLRGEEPRYRVV